MLDDIQDELLADQGIPVSQPTTLPNQKPKRFFDIPISVVQTVSVYMIVVQKRSTKASCQQVDIEAVILNAQALFHDGVKYRNRFWYQHVAALIREIIGFIQIANDDFHLAHSSIPHYEEDRDLKDQLDKLVIIRSYLSDIVHFIPGNRLGILNRLYPAERYGSMNKQVFFTEEMDGESHFEKVCIDLIYILNDIFEKYCVGSTSSG